MTEIFTNVALILLFICLGGVFAAAEMALVTLRDSQVKQLSSKGKRGRAIARITSDPNLFLSAVQVGVTLMGFLSAAFGGATLAEHLTPVLVGVGLPAGLSATVSLVLITIIISYISIVLGELTAKRLAMQRAESFALVLGPMVDGLARLLRPVIWFLGLSTNFVVRLVGGDPHASREEVTDEELRAMVSGSATLGDEVRQIMDDVFDVGDRSLREVMVPRTEVAFLPGDMPTWKAIREVRDAPHSRYPVMRDSVDDVIGFVHVRDLLDPSLAKSQLPLSRLARPVLSLPASVRVLPALTMMRRERAHLAIIRDEYGGTEGIATMEDLVEELIGDINDEYDVVEVAQRLTGDREIEDDGLTTLEEFADRYDCVLPEGPYDTIAGWFMAQLGRMPEVGDEVEAVLDQRDGSARPRLRFTITELDGRRASRLRISVVDAGEVTE